jgi:hypothetical protein
VLSSWAMELEKMQKQFKSARRIQYTITIVAILIAIVHLLWPAITIDGTTLLLLVIAIVPWLVPLFKSLEFPGGWKVEFQELEKIENDADKAGLLAPASEVSKPPQYSFQLISKDDPNLALAGLRIEIEKRLIQLAQAKGIQTKRQGVDKLLYALEDQRVFTSGEGGVLADMIGTLNAASHGANIDRDAAEWAMDVGPRLLMSLDAKIKL